MREMYRTGSTSRNPLDEVVFLRRQVDELAAASNGRVIDEAIAAGQITAAHRGWAEDYAAKDPRGFEQFLASAPAVYAPTTPEDAAVIQFQARVAEALEADPTLDLAAAQSQVAREEPELVRAAYGR